MKRTLRISRSRKAQEEDEIEDLDKVIADIQEKASRDVSLDVGADDLDFIPEEEVSVPKRDPIGVNVRSGGKRKIFINELDLNMIPPTLENFQDPSHTGSKIVVISKPGQGKSTIIRSILYEKSQIFPCAQIYSGTEDSNHAYGKFIPSTFIHNKYDPNAYTEFIKRQKIAKQYLENPWSVVVWDDIAEDPRIFNAPLVQGTYKNGRHWKILHILALQYALDIKPVIRGNVDGTFILRETNKRNREILYKNFASAIDDFSDFCSIMDQVTQNFTALYINNRVQSNKFEDCVFWYKAREDLPEDFKFGCKEFWMFHNERYNPLYIDPVTV